MYIAQVTADLAKRLKTFEIYFNNIGYYFKFKDRVPDCLQSGVVYKYKCGRCNSSYIGKTFRHLVKRIEEHTSISALTGKSLKCFKCTPPREHLLTCNTVNTKENFQVLTNEKDRFLLKIKESLFIYRDNPDLNDRTQSIPLFLFK